MDHILNARRMIEGMNILDNSRGRKIMAGDANRSKGYRRLMLTSLVLIFVFLFVPCATQAASDRAQKKPSAFERENNETIEDLVLPIPKPWTGDFGGMKEKRMIRILVPYSKTFFFLDRGRKRGTAYELGMAFENWLNKKYKLKTLRMRVLFIPTARDRLIPGLIGGLGDIAAGNLTITPDRSKRIDFSIPSLKDVKELVVTGPSAPPLNVMEDLGGKELFVRRSSSYYEHLVALNKTFKQKIILKAAEEEMEDEDLLEMVNAGLIPMVVVEDHKAHFWIQIFDDITVREDLAVNTGGRVAWALRKNSPLLLAEVNDFLKNHVQRTGLGNIILRRYLRSTRHLKNALSEREIEQFQRVVDLFKKYGAKYEFDYLMLMAQGYQESRLRQSAKSHRGAVGIMQILPSTAENPPINIEDIHKSAENNIHAGTKYLRWIVDTYLEDPTIDPKNRILLAFAGYNAGPGNLRKFRRVAEKSGLDPNVWFGNVEHAAARIIGRETVQYVSNIHKYYTAYKLIEYHRLAKHP